MQIRQMPNAEGPEVMVPGTQSTSYRCSLPGLAGFASVPSPGTASFFAQPGSPRQSDLPVRFSARDSRLAQVVYVVLGWLPLLELAPQDRVLAHLA
jgi:hypothetical protein